MYPKFPSRWEIFYGLQLCTSSFCHSMLSCSYYYPFLLCLAESWVEVGGATSTETSRQDELIDLIADAAQEDTRLK